MLNNFNRNHSRKYSKYLCKISCQSVSIFLRNHGHRFEKHSLEKYAIKVSCFSSPHFVFLHYSTYSGFYSLTSVHGTQFGSMYNGHCLAISDICIYNSLSNLLLPALLVCPLYFCIIWHVMAVIHWLNSAWASVILYLVLFIFKEIFILLALQIHTCREYVKLLVSWIGSEITSSFRQAQDMFAAINNAVLHLIEADITPLFVRVRV